MDLGVEAPLLQPQADLADAYVPMSDVIMSQAATNPALTAFNGNTLGVGFSGSGFLVRKSEDSWPQTCFETA